MTPTDELIQRAEALAEEKPVAFRVKDFADGWMLFKDEADAADMAFDYGSLVEPLFSSSSRELVRALEEARGESADLKTALSMANAQAADNWHRALVAEAALSSANRRNSETIEALKDALFDYGSHHPSCSYDGPLNICDCGFREALLSNPAVAQETKE